ncbi:MAG TPA: ACT domain-containing protein [bacterium]|nr:ACT domain-containing protein [bacterium]
MQVKQISIFVENRAGRLEEISGVLEKENINIRALSLADTSDFGIIRLIVNKPDAAVTALREAGFTIRESNVIACAIEDKPGGLHRLLKLFADLDVSIEYMYSFFERHLEKAVIIIRVEDPEEAIQILRKGGAELLKAEQIYAA